MIFILGGRGRLGQALAARYDPSEVACVERSVYEAWSGDAASADIQEYFSQHRSTQSVIYICSGLLDPRLTAEQLLAVNYQLPRNVIESVATLGIRVVTFGTAMEHTLTSNSYVRSKLKLSEFVEQVNTRGVVATHIRIHTLYGSGEPSPFMFLGQILNALRGDTPFSMTMGRQLREYHHVDDDAMAIKSLIDAEVNAVVDLSHGRPVTLRSLAESVFSSLGKSHLLQLGALPEPAEENFDVVFEVPAVLTGMPFRDSNSAVVEYIKSRINA